MIWASVEKFGSRSKAKYNPRHLPQVKEIIYFQS
jgi:hypothetical protein